MRAAVPGKRPRKRRPSRPRVALAPMLARLAGDADVARVARGFLLSLVADGWRCLVILDDRVRVRSRSGRDLTPELPAIAGALQALRARDGAVTVLDGVLPLPPAGDGALPGLADVTALEAIDVLCAAGRDVTALPLHERQAMLRAQRWPAGDALRAVPAWPGDASAAVAQLAATPGRVLFARRATSRYAPGRRSSDWLVFGGRASEELLLCGIAASGALVLGAPTPHGLAFAGLAWPTRLARVLAQRCREGDPPLVPGEMWPSLGAVTWVEPDLWLAVEPDVRPGSGRGGPRYRLLRVQEDLARPFAEVARRAAAPLRDPEPAP